MEDMIANILDKYNNPAARINKADRAGLNKLVKELTEMARELYGLHQWADDDADDEMIRDAVDAAYYDRDNAKRKARAMR